MSQQNVDATYRYFAAFNARDWATMSSLFCENFESYDGALNIRTTTRDQHMDYVRNFVAILPDIRCDDVFAIDAGGNLVISMFTWNGTDSGTGFVPGNPTDRALLGSRVCELRYFDDESRMIADEGYYDLVRPMASLGLVSPAGELTPTVPIGPVVTLLREDGRL